MVDSDFSLSIIIPNYNKSKYISDCVYSVLKQTYIFDEIIIVDDCSSDDSKHILKNLELVDSRIKVLYLEKNGGVSNARNVGVSNSRCNYITFLDSDDIYLNKDKLFNEMKLIKRYKKRGKDIIAYSQDININENGSIIQKKFPWFFVPRGEVLTDSISGFRKIKAPRDYIVNKTNFLSVGGYSYPEDYYEDLDLRIRLALKFKFRYTYKVGTGYRVTNNGLSSNHSYEEAVCASDTIRKNYYKDLSIMLKTIIRLKRVISNLYTFFYNFFEGFLR